MSSYLSRLLDEQGENRRVIDKWRQQRNVNPFLSEAEEGQEDEESPFASLRKIGEDMWRKFNESRQEQAPAPEQDVFAESRQQIEVPPMTTSAEAVGRLFRGQPRGEEGGNPPYEEFRNQYWQQVGAPDLLTRHRFGLRPSEEKALASLLPEWENKAKVAYDVQYGQGAAQTAILAGAPRKAGVLLGGVGQGAGAIASNIMEPQLGLAATTPVDVLFAGMDVAAGGAVVKPLIKKGVQLTRQAAPVVGRTFAEAAAGEVGLVGEPRAKYYPTAGAVVPKEKPPSPFERHLPFTQENIAYFDRLKALMSDKARWAQVEAARKTEIKAELKAYEHWSGRLRDTSEYKPRTPEQIAVDEQRIQAGVYEPGRPPSGFWVRSIGRERYESLPPGEKAAVDQMIEQTREASEAASRKVRQEAGMPEAGLQADIFGGTTEFRPGGKGKVTQESLDDYLKLKRAEDAAAAEAKLTKPKQVILDASKSALDEIDGLRIKYAHDPQYVGSLLEEELASIEWELNARGQPFHGGAKAKYPGVPLKVLGERWHIYEDAVAAYRNELPIFKDGWDTATVPARRELAQQQGLSGTVGSKEWENLSAEEIRVLRQPDVPSGLLKVEPVKAPEVPVSPEIPAEVAKPPVAPAGGAEPPSGKIPPTAVAAAPEPPEFGKGAPGIKPVVQAAKVAETLEPLAADIEKLDLPNQLKAIHREVQIDVDTVKQSLTGKRDFGSRLTWAILKDSERQLSHADDLIGQIETGKKVSDEAIARLQARLVRTRELFKKSIQTESDVKQILTDYANSILPLEERGKILVAIKNAKTERDMEVVMSRIEVLGEVVEKKSIIKDIAAIDTTDLPGPYKTKINELLSRFDVKYRSEKALSSLEATRRYVARMVDEGLPVNVPDQILDLLFKTHLQDFTVDQLNILKNELGGLVHQAKLKNKLIGIQAQRRVDTAVKELSDHLGTPPPIGTPITAESTKVPFWKGVGEKVSAVATRFDRMERTLYSLDRYEDKGKLWKFFYEPVDIATNAKVKNIYTTMDTFRAMLKNKGIDLAQVLKGTVKIDKAVMSPSEKIGVYLHSLNEDNLLHLKYGNGFSDELIGKVTSSLTPQEKAIADWIHDYFVTSGTEISKVRTLVEGKSLGVVKDYFPIIINWDANAAIDVGKQLAQEQAARFSSKWASSGIKKSFLKERSHSAIQPVQLDAMSIFLDRLESFEHYKNFAPVIRDMQLVQKDVAFKAAFENRAGKATYDVLTQWIKDVAETNPLRATSHAESIIRQMRVNAVTATLGLNITTALKQFPSFFSGMTEAGVVPVMKGLFTYLRHPQDTVALIKQYAPQIYTRSFEREIAEAKIMKNIASRVNQVMSAREVFTLMSTTMDKVAVSGIWRGAFDNALRKGMSAAEAGMYATKAIRKTQAFFSVKDLPEYYRSGEFAKALTIFTNELNNLWQLTRYEMVGKTLAGKQSVPTMLGKMFLGIVMPSLLIGAVSRSRPAQNAKELAEDVGNQAIAMIPIVGKLIGLGYQNYYGNNLVSTELLTKINEVGFKLNKGAWQSALKDMPELAGYAAGIPVVQPMRTVKGIVDLATKKSDDWQRLIWSEYAVNRAKTPGQKITKTVSEAMPKLGQPDVETLKKKVEQATTPEMKAYIQEKGDIYSTSDIGSDIHQLTKDMVLDEMSPDKFPSIVYGYKRAELSFKRYEGIPPDRREDFRRENPTIDAQLFFWGKVTTTQTREARSIVEDMVRQYGIPENAVPGMRKNPSTGGGSMPSGFRAPTLSGTRRVVPSPFRSTGRRVVPSPFRR